MAALAELIERAGCGCGVDRAIGLIKKRDRSATPGQLLVAMAQSQSLGEAALAALDRQRADLAAAQLSAVAGIPRTKTAGLARGFGAG